VHATFEQRCSPLSSTGEQRNQPSSTVLGGRSTLLSGRALLGDLGAATPEHRAVLLRGVTF